MALIFERGVSDKSNGPRKRNCLGFEGSNVPFFWIADGSKQFSRREDDLMIRKQNSSRGKMVLQGFGDFRPQLGPLSQQKRRKKLKLGAGVQLYRFDEDAEEPQSAERCGMLRRMAQELSQGLREDGYVTKHYWYHKQFAETFAAADAVKCVAEIFRRKKKPDESPVRSVLLATYRLYRPGDGDVSPRPTTPATGAVLSPEERAAMLLQELLDYGFIRRVSKRETRSSIGWEATEHVVRSKRRFKITKHTLYRFDDDLSEIQLRVTVVRASQLGLVLAGIKRPRLVVRLELESSTRVLETLAVKRSDRPEWQAHFVFGIDDVATKRFLVHSNDAPSRSLRVVLVQRRNAPFGDKDLGAVEIPLQSLPRILASPAKAHEVARLAQFTRWYDLSPIAPKGVTMVLQSPKTTTRFRSRTPRPPKIASSPTTRTTTTRIHKPP